MVASSSDSTLSRLSLDELVELLLMSPPTQELARKELAYRLETDIFEYFKDSKKASAHQQVALGEYMETEPRFADFMKEVREHVLVAKQDPIFRIPVDQ